MEPGPRIRPRGDQSTPRQERGTPGQKWIRIMAPDASLLVVSLHEAPVVSVGRGCLTASVAGPHGTGRGN